MIKNASEFLKRKIAIVRKRSKKIRHVLPNKIIRLVKDAEKGVVSFAKKGIDIESKCKYVNIYHCALQKTGTQWMFDVLSDPIVYRYSGMTVEKFKVPRRKSQTHPLRSLKEPFKKDTIVSGVSGTYKNYVKDIPKNDGNDVAFYVVRDPREMVVSWYFSTRENHLVDRGSMMHVHRNKLRSKSKKEGLIYTIELFDWKGKFEVMRSWMDKDNKENIKVVKFEDITNESFSTFKCLFEFLDIKIPNEELSNLVKSYSFKTLTGRKKGKEDRSSHMRGGVSKSWKKHFDDDLLKLFNSKAHDIVVGYNYSD